MRDDLEIIDSGCMAYASFSSNLRNEAADIPTSRVASKRGRTP